MTNTSEQFDLVEQFYSLRLGVDVTRLSPGRREVIESPRRLEPEASYSFLRPLWWMEFEDGRSVVVVPPGAARAVEQSLAELAELPSPLESGLAPLRGVMDEFLVGRTMPPTDRAYCDVRFACDASRLRPHSDGPCVRLHDDSIPPAEGIWMPTHCFPDGVVYGVVADGVVASVAYAHRTGTMENQVADIGLVTSPPYRRRGYARTVVSAVVADFARRGGQAVYSCDPGNAASIATAHSVGFTPYGRSLILISHHRRDSNTYALFTKSDVSGTAKAGRSMRTH